MRIVVQYLDILPPHHFKRKAGFPLWTISIAISGRSLIAHGSHSIVVEPGFVTMIRPETPYHTTIGEDERHIEYYALLVIPEDWRMWVDWPELLPGHFSVKVAGTPAWQQTVAAFATASEHSAAGEVGDDLAFNAIERALLMASLANKAHSRPILDDRIEAAIAFARLRLNEKLDVEALAKVSHVSPSWLAHLFTKQLGESPMRHVEMLRMRRAQELLLSTRMPIREIARVVGYDNPYHFSDRFRSRIGQSPRAFRQNPYKSVESELSTLKR